MKKFIVICSMMVFMVSYQLRAQEYTLEQLVEYGLKNSETIQQAALALATSKSLATSATLNLLPDITGTGSWANDFYSRDNLQGQINPTGSLGFAISKNISFNDPSWYNYRFANYDKTSAEYQYQSKVSNYAYNVFSAYLTVLEAQKQLESLLENQKLQERILEESKALRAAGKNTIYDVRSSEINLINAKISILKLENTIKTNRQKLFTLVNFNDEGNKLQDIELNNDNYIIPPIDIDKVFAIRQAKTQIEKQKLMTRQSKIDYLPEISLRYNYTRSVSGKNFAFDDYSTNHTLSLNLSYSLWNLLTNKESVKRADFSLKSNALSLQEQKKDISDQYTQLSNELSYLTQLNDLYIQKKTQAQDNLTIAEERYRLGMIAQLDLDKTRSEYLDAGISLDNNKYQILLTRESLNNLLSQKIMGKW